MDLFAALDYEQPENRASTVLLAVVYHLTPRARELLLPGVVEPGLLRTEEIKVQHAISVGILDGWLRWSGRRVVVMEAKVDDALGAEQPRRYLRWLREQEEAERVLWLVTRDRPAVASLVEELQREHLGGVAVVWDTWTALADRAATLAAGADPDLGSSDQLLLAALARRLRATAVATAPAPEVDLAVAGLALGALPQIAALRQTLLSWLNGLAWLPATWERQARRDAWVDLSVCAGRDLKLAISRPRGEKALSVTWWVEVYAPAKRSPRWPSDHAVGACLRAGVFLGGVAATERALEPLRAVLGVPGTDARSDYEAAPEYTPWTFDTGTYHEVWWNVHIDLADLPRTSASLRIALAAQARRIAPLIDGGLPALGIGAD